MQRQKQAIKQNARYHVDFPLRQSQAALSHQIDEFQGAALQFEKGAKTATEAEDASRTAALLSDFQPGLHT